MNQGRWSAEEHEQFVEGYKRHGRQWKILAEVVSCFAVQGHSFRNLVADILLSVNVILDYHTDSPANSNTRAKVLQQIV